MVYSDIYRNKAALYDYVYGNIDSLDEDETLEFVKWFLSYHGFTTEDRNKSILDMGCGTGRLLIPLTHQGYSILGMDPYSAMIERATKKAEEKNIEIKIEKGSFQKLEKKESFDLILSINGSMA